MSAFPVRLEPLGSRAGALAALIAAACSGPPGAGRSLGDDLGTFGVVATETENTCGPGALGSSERFDFEVDLSRAHSELFWNGAVGGRIDSSLAFELRAAVRVELRPATPSDPGCVIDRTDEIAGVLEEQASQGVTGFAAVMSYAFASESAEGCTEGVPQESGLPVLPCRLDYMLAARRLRVPEQ
jgi:hypothetical protein